MSGTEFAGLSAAAAAAGIINAVAGGGTLLTFPVLLLFGTPPVVANATSTLALQLGTAGSLWGYRRQLASVKPWLIRFTPVSLLGGWLGSVLLTHSSNEFFARLIPYLLLFATVLFLAQGMFRRFAGFDGASAPHPRHRTLWAALVFQFAVAVYGGYFGAGIGILMLASLGFLGLTDIHEMNGLKTVLSSLINLVASIWFIWSGLIDWPKTVVMTLGALVGYYIGSHSVQFLPQHRVRQLITGIGFVISTAMFWKQIRG